MVQPAVLGGGVWRVDNKAFDGREHFERVHTRRVGRERVGHADAVLTKAQNLMELEATIASRNSVHNGVRQKKESVRFSSFTTLLFLEKKKDQTSADDEYYKV